MANTKDYTALDFTTDNPEKLFSDVRSISEDYRITEEKKWAKWIQTYSLDINMAGRDPDRVNYADPKPYSMVETQVAKDVKTLFGTRPYFPIEVKKDEWRPAASAIETLLDYFALEDQFFLKMVKMCRQIRVCGHWFNEVYWRTDETNWDGEKIERACWRSIPPWMVGIDPFADSITEGRWLYDVRLISRSELKSWAKTAGIKIDWEKIKGDFGVNPVGSKMQETYLRYGPGQGKVDADMTVFVRMYLRAEKRLIILINGTTVIYDEKNVAQPKITSFANQSSIYQHQLYGVSMLESSYRLFQLLNKSMEHIFNTQDQQLDGVWLYDDTVFDQDNLSATSGARIPADGKVSDENFREIKSSPLTNDAYVLPQTLNQTLNETEAITAANMGQLSARKTTAFEIGQTKQGSDDRSALKQRMIETGGFEVQAQRSIECISDGIKTRPDLAKKILGENDFIRLTALVMTTQSMNPKDIPGGAHFYYRGADLMADKEGKQNERIAYKQTLNAIPNPAEMDRAIISKTDAFTKEDIEKMFAPPAPPPMAPDQGMPNAPQPQGVPSIQQANPVPTGASEITAGGGGQ